MNNQETINEEKFYAIIEYCGLVGTAFIARDDLSYLIITAEGRGLKDQFVEWLLTHDLRFGVRDDLKKIQQAN